MKVIKEIDVSLLKKLIGKVLPMTDDELFILKNYEVPNLSMVIDKFFDLNYKDVSTAYNLNNLVFMLTTLNKIILNNTPNNLSILKRVKVIDIKNDNKTLYINVEYEFE